MQNIQEITQEVAETKNMESNIGQDTTAESASSTMVISEIESKIEQKITELNLHLEEEAEPIITSVDIPIVEQQLLAKIGTFEQIILTKPAQILDEIEVKEQEDQKDQKDQIDHSLEHKLINKITAAAKFTQQQGAYLAEMAQSFAEELEQLTIFYKTDKLGVLTELNQQQGLNTELLEKYNTANHKIAELSAVITELNLEKNKYIDQLQEQNETIKKLENLLINEQKLRKQADKRTQIAINKARQYVTQKREEEKRREAAEEQAKKAIVRAREVMGFFFNSTVDDSINKVKRQQQALLGGLSGFEDLLLKV